MNLVSGSVCLGGQTAYNPLLRTGFVLLLRGNGDRPDTTRVRLGCFSSEIDAVTRVYACIVGFSGSALSTLLTLQR